MALRSRYFVIAGLATALVASPGCGSGQGGEEGATQEQMRDPAWVQQKIKELDKDPTISTGKGKARAKAAH